MLDTPHNMEAEKSVLAAFMFGRSVDFLKAEHFYSDTHKLLFRAIEKLQQDGEPVDAVTVRHKAMKLEDRNIEPRVLFLIMETIPNMMHADYYGRIVYECWERRTAIQVSEWLYQQATDMSADMEAARKRVANWASKSRKISY